MSKNKVIAVKVSEEKLKEIGEFADKRGQTVAGMVRQWIYAQLEQQQVN